MPGSLPGFSILYDGLDYDGDETLGGEKDVILKKVFLPLSIINTLCITLQKGISDEPTSLFKNKPTLPCKAKLDPPIK